MDLRWRRGAGHWASSRSPRRVFALARDQARDRRPPPRRRTALRARRCPAARRRPSRSRGSSAAGSRWWLTAAQLLGTPYAELHLHDGEAACLEPAPRWPSSASPRRRPRTRVAEAWAPDGRGGTAGATARSAGAATRRPPRVPARVPGGRTAPLVLLANAAGPPLGGGGGSRSSTTCFRARSPCWRTRPRRPRDPSGRTAAAALRGGRRTATAGERQGADAARAIEHSGPAPPRRRSAAVLGPSSSRRRDGVAPKATCCRRPARCRARHKLLCSVTTFADLGLSEPILDALKRRRLRVAQPDPGAGHPRAAPGPRRDRPGADRHRQDRRVRPADDRVRRSRRPRRPGARAHADARAVHPGHPGAARLRRAQGHPARRRVRRRPDPHPAGPAQGGRADRRRHGRPRARPDLAPLADAALVPLPRARRGRRDARPRLPRGRREDPRAHARRPPDRAVQRDDAAGDPRRSPTATSTTR